MPPCVTPDVDHETLALIAALALDHGDADLARAVAEQALDGAFDPALSALLDKAVVAEESR